MLSGMFIPCKSLDTGAIFLPERIHDHASNHQKGAARRESLLSAEEY